MRLRHAYLILHLILLTATVEGQVSLVSVTLGSPAQAAALAALDLDIASDGPPVEIVIHSAEEMKALQAAGLNPKVLHNDLEAFYRSRFATFPNTDTTPPFGQGSLGGYYDYSQVVGAMDTLQSNYPQIMAAKVNLGLSIYGNPIWMWKISDNPNVDENEPEVLFDGLHHAREPISMQACIYLAKSLCENYNSDPTITRLVNTREIFIVPVVNPDGYIFNEGPNHTGGGIWRKNLRDNGDGTYGVDLNRNYGYHFGQDNIGSSGSGASETYRGTAAFSEPCTFAMKVFAESRSFSLGLTHHSYGGMVFIPPGHSNSTYAPQPVRSHYETLALEMQGLSPGYTAGYAWNLLGLSNGTTEDWWFGSLYGGQQMYGFSIEIGSSTDGFWPASTQIIPLCEQALVYQKYLLRAAGADLRVGAITVDDSGGMVLGSWEPGETISVVAPIRNGGTTDDVVTLSLESTNPWVQILTSTVNLGVIPGFSETTNASAPLLFRVLPGTPRGTNIDFSVVASSALSVTARAGFSQRTEHQAVLVLNDDFEGASSGWTVGAPGDNAIPSSLWVQDDPNGTTYAGQPWNPEDDHTAGAGVRCWFTGQGIPGGSLSANDVDGITTLVSPIYDLSHVEDARVSYWRWFATTGHDPFTAQVSNDGGATWVTLESISYTANSWMQREFRIEDFLPRTSAMRFRFRASDDPNDSATEAAIDDFAIHGILPDLQLSVSGVPSPGSTLGILVSAPVFPNEPYALGCSATAAIGIPTTGGLIPLDFDWLFVLSLSNPLVFPGFLGTLDAQGTGSAAINVPVISGLSGFSFDLAGIVASNGTIVANSGALRLTIP